MDATESRLTDTEKANLALVKAYAEAFERRDLDKTLSLFSEDCVTISPYTENRSPVRTEGLAALRAKWEKGGWFAGEAAGEFADARTIIVRDEVALLVRTSGGRGYVDVFTFRDGKIVMKDHYIKHKRP